MTLRHAAQALIVLAAALTLAACVKRFAEPVQSGAPELSAAQFLDGLGVCAHLSGFAARSPEIAEVGRQLDYIGVTHVRDDARDDGAKMRARLQPLGEAGIRFDIIVGAGIAPEPAAFLPELEKIAPYLDAIEGPNEVELSKPSYDGLTGAAGASAYQQALYKAVRADPLLKPVPVYNFTVKFPKTAASFDPKAAAADVANVHSYIGHGRPLGAKLAQDLKQTVKAAPGRPVIVSELGYMTLRYNPLNKAGVGGNGVDEATQAKLTLDAVLDAAALGVKRTYVYELRDEGPDPKDIDGEAHFGVFAADGRPKPLAVALHNLAEILKDPGAQAASPPPPLSWRIAPLGADGGVKIQVLTLRKRGGDAYLILWREPQVWSDFKHAPLTVVTTQKLAVVFGHAPRRLERFDPLRSSAPVFLPAAGGRAELILSDRPLILHVSG